MKIALAQINPTVGNLAANAAKIAAAHARNLSSDIVMVPELALSGYPPEDLVLKPAFMDAIAAEAQKLCALTAHGPALLLSTPWAMDGGIYNALLFMCDGAIAHVIPKHHLPNYGVFDEVRIFKAGPLPKPVTYKGRCIGFMTCEDAWYPDVAAHLKQHGAEMLIAPNASPYDEIKTDARLDVARARVTETGLPFLYLNQVGGQDELLFDGASFGLNADGSIAFRMKAFAEDETVATFDGTWKTTGTATSWPEDEESIYEALKLSLRDYVLKNGFGGVLLGLSGGIDSALVAVIAAEALGPDKVTCVMMPSPYTAQMSLDDAALLASNLGCEYRTITIEDGMKAFGAMLGRDADIGVTPENIQSRLRGMILMALSNAGGRMVVSTGNKSEMAVGYATLYGDMCGGFAVLKDVYKTQVFAICKWINSRAGKPLIPERIITRPPSAELKADQTDQDTLPPYDVLDGILEGLIEKELRRREIVAQGYDAAVVTRVAAMLDRAEYKRRQAPPGPKITARAFGRERRYPITNGFKPAPLENPAENG
ncbi:MAG: NAD+ synthase [Alphaproteobacteria bacterium]|nr:NAD+ synthase [Alphaproteobacteria bacterium]